MSALPALGIAVVALLGLALLFAGGRAARRARLSDGQRLPILTTGLFGFGVFCLLLAGSGFRHFGGFTEVGQGATAYRCDAWWVQMRSSAGATDGDDLPSRECRQAAVRAILPTIGESAIGGGVAALVAQPIVILRRRRFNRALEQVVISSN